jgi:hypothetical protein
MKEKLFATKVRVCDDLINSVHVTTADIVPGQLFSSGVQFDVTVRSVFRRREDISNSCCDYVQHIQSADKAPLHEQELLTKEYSETRTESTNKRVL